MANTWGGRRDNRKKEGKIDKRGGRRVAGPGKKLGRPKKMNIQEGTIVMELQALGNQDVRVLTVNRAFNLAVIQFRELDKTPSEQNTRTVTLDKLQPKD